MAIKVINIAEAHLTEPIRERLNYIRQNPSRGGYCRFYKHGAIAIHNFGSVSSPFVVERVSYNSRGTIGRSIRVARENSLKAKWEKQQETAHKIGLLGMIEIYGLEKAIDKSSGDDRTFLKNLVGKSEDEVEQVVKKITKEYYSVRI